MSYTKTAIGVTGAEAVVPHEFDTIEDAVEYIKDIGGGKVSVRYGTYVEDSIAFGNIPIIIDGQGSIIEPTTDNRTIFDVDALATWGTDDEEIMPIIENFRFYNDTYTGCTAIQLQDISRVGIRNISVRGETTKQWAEGLRLDCTTGHWTEGIEVDSLYTDYCTIAINALATTGVNSLDHCHLNRLWGNLRTDGDKGMFYQDTILHMNHGTIWGHYYVRPQTCIGWDIDGRSSKCWWHLGVEVSPGVGAAVNRIGVDFTGADMLRGHVWVNYIGDDADYTDIVKSNVRIHNLHIMGEGHMEVGTTALIDPARYNESVFTVWAEPIYENNQFAPFEVGRMTLGEDGISQFDCLCIDLAIDPDPVRTHADTRDAPCLGMAMAAGDENDTIPVMLNGIVRRDAWGWTRGVRLYVDEGVGNEGDMTETAPNTAGDVVNHVANTLNDDTVHFFSNGYYEVV